MRFISIGIFLFSISIFSVKAQNNSAPDSLFAAIEKLEHDTVKVSILCKYAIAELNHEKAIAAANRAIELSESLPFLYQYKSKTSLGKALYNATRYYESVEVLENLLAECKNNATAKQLVEVMIGISEGLLRTASYDISLKYSNRALKISDSISYPYGTAQALNQAGKVYYTMQQYDRCKEYYDQALDIYRDYPNKNLVATLYNNQGIVYANEGEYEKALDYYDSSLVIRIKENNAYDMALIYNNMAVVYEEQKKYYLARDYYRTSLKLNKKAANQTQLPLYLLNLGNIYGILQQYDSGVYYLEKAIRHTEQTGNIEYRTISYLFLSNLYESKGDYRNAYLSHQRFSENERNLLINAKTRSLYDIESQYRLEKSETKNKILLQRTALNKEKQIRQNAVIVSVTGGLISAILFILVIYRNYRKKNQTNSLLSKLNDEIKNQNQVLTDQKEEIESQANDLSSANEEIQSINQNLEKIVQTRTRQLEIANHELQTFLYRASHDLKGPLASIQGLTLLANKETNPTVLHDYIDRLHTTTRHMDRTLRKLMALNALSNISDAPEKISFEKLIFDSVAVYQEVMDKKHIKLSVDIEEIDNFYSFPMVLKTIVTQLLDNCVNYCKPGKENESLIEIKVEEKDASIQFCIKDNGIGINDYILPNIFKMFYRGNERSSGNGLGLYIVQNSVKKLKGVVKIKSREFEFTEVKISIPKNS